MLTIFTIPKAFKGHIDIIQRNAIKSWTLLHPTPEIILFGDDEGTEDASGEFGVCHIPKVARNEYATPLFNDIFNKAKIAGNHNILCYMNSDVILMSDFMKTVEEVTRHKRLFLMIGIRHNLDVSEPLDFGLHWEEELKDRVGQEGKFYSAKGIEYHVFPRSLSWGDIPPFAIGRNTYDFWPIYQARLQRIPVIDATPAAVAVHQNHGYSHPCSGPEAKRNIELIGSSVIFTIEDATHILLPTQKGLKLVLSRRYSCHRLFTTMFLLFPKLRPFLRRLQRFLLAIWPIKKNKD